MDVKFIWGNTNYQFAVSNSVGNSGGILCVWEQSIFKKDNVMISDNFIALFGTWLPSNTKVLLVAIYAPQSNVFKRTLWEYISLLISRWEGETLVMGDFNVVRSIAERFGSTFDQIGARDFNHFISSSGLVDVKMEGYAFTWSLSSAKKMSKLDRFLVTDDLISVFPPSTVIVLDHDFDLMVEQAWSSFSHTDSNGLIRFKKKLQDLKKIIRGWIKDKNLSQTGIKIRISEDLSRIDKELDSGNVSDELLSKRLELHRKLRDLNSLDSKDYAQKAKIKWAIEGDENYKFFHGCINKKRSQLAIRGIFINGDWTTDPMAIKDAFLEHFASRLRPPDRFRLKLITPFPNPLSPDQAFIFKVDFAKAYDSVRWDYLLDVLIAFGCGPNWCKWIRGIFSSAMASILVNGSPTSEFSFYCGLKKGDPLAPFLFILIMESLHISVSKAVNEGVFKGLSIHGSDPISHIFYADDAVFIGEWSEKNLVNLVRILDCFYLASGLKINLHKSQVLGVGIPRAVIDQAPKRVLSEMESIRSKFFKGGDQSDKKISWIAWDKVLSSKKKGGLGVSSLFALNRGLILKWVLKSKGFDFLSHCKKGIGDGRCTRFWLDIWILDKPLSVRFPRIFSLETDKSVTVAAKWEASSFSDSFRRPVRVGVEREQWQSLTSLTDSVSFSSSFDRWVFDLNGDGTFQVKDIRSSLDEIFLPSSDLATSRCKSGISWECWLKNPYLISL
nr:RNA-directed DNA polymerase, eukaryota [Tanacetum cinerariifolium]